MEERLQKILSACGVGSRRAMEQVILAGRVTVNGKTAGLGDKADRERDIIAVDGIPVNRTSELVYLMLRKPMGCVTTLSDDRGRKTVADLVENCGTRVWPVGRLDYDSEGLLILTNDGELTHRLLHPSRQVEKEYQVEVIGDVAAALPMLRSPMKLDGISLKPARVKELGKEGGRVKLSVIIHEGKNRQVRRMCAQAGLRVVRLCRVREGSLSLDETLKPGQWRFLTEAEAASLRSECGISERKRKN